MPWGVSSRQKAESLLQMTFGQDLGSLTESWDSKGGWVIPCL